MAKLSDYVGEGRISELVAWPGRELQVRVLLLHCHEIQEADFAARDTFVRKGQTMDAMNQSAFACEVEYQLLYRMLLKPDDERPVEGRFFASTDELKRTLPYDLVLHFFGIHGAMRDRRAVELKLRLTDGA